MPTTARYLSSIKNVPTVFQKIQHGIPPDRFNLDHLKAIGFGSSNDRAIIPLLKDLGFLTGDGAPTQRYKDYRDASRSKAVMAEALREAYPDLFVINERLSKADKDAVAGRFKSLHDSSDVLADFQARTFFALLELADLNALNKNTTISLDDIPEKVLPENHNERSGSDAAGFPLTYRLEVQLPATKDIEVFRAIFRAMREELLNG